MAARIREVDAAILAGRWNDARQELEGLTRRHSSHAPAWRRLGELAMARGAFDDALQCYEHLRTLPGERIFALCGAASVALLRGRRDEAQAMVEVALDEDPTSELAMRVWQIILHYQPDLDATSLADAARWLREQRGSARPPTVRSRARDTMGHREHSKLRMGYISPDFREHSIMWFMLPLMRAHDRSACAWYGYHLGHQSDRYTTLIRSEFDGWRECGERSVAAVTDMIAADEIDVLIDLAGTFGDVKTEVFARQPAPVSAHYLGFCGAVGIPGIEHRISDEIADPFGQEADAVEFIHRVAVGGAFHCFDPVDEVAPAAEAPWQQQGGITFGSFNAYPKLNPVVANVWSRLIARVPGSRLVLRSESFADAVAREHCQAMFADAGLAPDRLQVCPPVALRARHFADYAAIDVALDPFPYNGVTTTCDALWQGVPVATVQGTRHSGRVAEGILRGAGLDAWVFADPDELIDRMAVRMAGTPDLPDRQALAEGFRHTQRERAPRLARELETIYHRLAEEAKA